MTWCSRAVNFAPFSRSATSRTRVHAGIMASGFLQPPLLSIFEGGLWDLPIPVKEVSTHAQGLRLRWAQTCLAFSVRLVLPCDLFNSLGTQMDLISQLNTWPTCAPVNASPSGLPLRVHDSGSEWLAKPSLCDSFIHFSFPV